MVALGNKWASTLGVSVAMKVRSSSKRPYLWGNADDVAHRHQVCHKQVYGCLRYNNEESSDIPQRHITKSGQEPLNGAVFLPLYGTLSEPLTWPFIMPPHAYGRSKTACTKTMRPSSRLRLLACVMAAIASPMTR